MKNIDKCGLLRMYGLKHAFLEGHFAEAVANLEKYRNLSIDEMVYVKQNEFNENLYPRPNDHVTVKIKHVDADDSDILFSLFGTVIKVDEETSYGSWSEVKISAIEGNKISPVIMKFDSEALKTL